MRVGFSLASMVLALWVFIGMFGAGIASGILSCMPFELQPNILPLAKGWVVVSFILACWLVIDVHRD